MDAHIMSTKNSNPARRTERSVKVKGHTITYSFFRMVWRLIVENLPGHEANRGKHLTIMDLFGLHNWQYLKRGQKTKAGICLSYLVDRQRIALTKATKRRGNTLLYILK